jgi:hypothetical protein
VKKKMKDLWTTLPAEHPLSRRIKHALVADVAGAIAWQAAASLAWTAGYDIEPPPTTFGDRLVELRKSDGRAAGRMMSERSAELAAERGAARLFAGRRAWAKGPPQREIDAKRVAQREAAELDAAVEKRAAQLVAEQSTKSQETARARARKELT